MGAGLVNARMALRRCLLLPRLSIAHVGAVVLRAEGKATTDGTPKIMSNSLDNKLVVLIGGNGIDASVEKLPGIACSLAGAVCGGL